jgi:hypothetical protein
MIVIGLLKFYFKVVLKIYFKVVFKSDSTRCIEVVF